MSSLNINEGNLEGLASDNKSGGESTFSNYCANSSINGVKYLSGRGRSFWAKSFWITAFVISLSVCMCSIVMLWKKWDQTPAIISSTESSTSLWKIPFPAVTICPETKIKSEFFNFTEAYHQAQDLDYKNMSEDQLLRLETLALVCDPHLLEESEAFQKNSDAGCVEMLRNMSVSIDEMLFVCKWRNHMTDCQGMFSEILTEEGICYTFNLVSPNQLLKEEKLHSDYTHYRGNTSSPKWHMENGYSLDGNLHSYPRRALAGAKAGLYILLRLYEHDFDYICRGPVQGFKVLVHSPNEYPQVSTSFFRVPLEQEVIVTVKPHQFITSEGLKDYTPERRQCYFNNERHLRFFKDYTKQNCELECLSQYVLKKCGCVRFSMPRDNATKICGGLSIECYSKAEDELLMLEMEQQLDGLPETHCNCLPACTSVHYETEISQAYFDWKELFKAYRNHLDEFPGMRLARLTIFFKDNHFTTTERSRSYGFVSFMAGCGGLLALFIGISFLSIVEIIYHCTRRICHQKIGRSGEEIHLTPRDESTGEEALIITKIN